MVHFDAIGCIVGEGTTSEGTTRRVAEQQSSREQRGGEGRYECEGCSKSILFVAQRRGSTDGKGVAARRPRARRPCYRVSSIRLAKSRSLPNGRWCALVTIFQGRSRIFACFQGFFGWGGRCASRITGAHQGGPKLGPRRDVRVERSTRQQGKVSGAGS